MRSFRPPRSLHPGRLHARNPTHPQWQDPSVPLWEALDFSGVHQPPCAHPVKEAENKNVRGEQIREQRPGREAGGWASPQGVRSTAGAK